MATVTTLRLSPADHGRRLDPHEYESAEFDGEGLYELARGVLEVVNVPDEYPHGMIVDCLMTILHAYRRNHPDQIHRIGGGSEFRLVLPAMHSDRHPDVAIALRATIPNPRGQRPPSLVMEVVSEGVEARHRDYVTKRAEYLAYGLAEYWIVDPHDRKLTVLLRDGDQWLERLFQADQSAEGLVLPGFAVNLPDLWSAGTQQED
jgi:Uma2 family endonuclease